MSCAACDAGLRCVAHSPLIAELCDDEPGIDVGRWRRAGQRPLDLRRAEAEERRERFRAALAEHGGYAQAGRALGVSRQCVHAALNGPRRSRGAA